MKCNFKVHYFIDGTVSLLHTKLGVACTTGLLTLTGGVAIHFNDIGWDLDHLKAVIELNYQAFGIL